MLSGNSKIRFCWSGSIDRFHGNRRATPTTICMSQFYLSVCLSIYCIYLFTVYTVSIYCVNLSTLSIHQSTVSIYVLQRSIYLRYLTMSLSSYIYLLYPSHLSIFTAPNHHIDPSISLTHTHTHTHTLTHTPTHTHTLHTKRDVSQPSLSTGFVLPWSNQISGEPLQPSSHYSAVGLQCACNTLLHAVPSEASSRQATSHIISL